MRLEITSGPDAGRTVDLRDQLTLGREGSVNVVLRDPKSSRQHAKLTMRPDGLVALRDLGSSNGTFVNGQQVQEATLRGGEEVRIGDTTMRVVADAPPPPPPVAGPGPSPSTIQRLVIQRGIRRVTVLGIVVLVLLVGVIVALVTGVFTGDDGDEGLTPAQVVDKVRPATVLVINNKGFGTGGRGSGWVWDASRGLIVTNAHVTAGALDEDAYTVSTGDKLTIEIAEEVRVGGENAREAKLRGQAFCEDIAVLEVDDRAGLETLPRFPDQDDLKIPEQVVAVGYPSTKNLTEGQAQQEADLTGNTGVVSTVKTTFQAIPGEGAGDPEVGPYRNVILTDTVINQGNSGGPLVNMDAQLVGMNSAIRTDVQGQNYAVGVDRINEVVPRLIEGEDVCPA
jgi:S1-C subfamily serine protease